MESLSRASPPVPLPPAQHIPEDRKGNAKVQNDSLFQGPKSVTDTDSHLTSLFILGAISHNKTMLLVCFFYFSKKKPQNNKNLPSF